MKTAYSRPTAVAARLIKNPNAGQLLARPVLLTARPAALQTVGGRSTFLAALSLLTRFCADLVVCLPSNAGAFAEKVAALATSIHHAGAIRMVDVAGVNWSSFGAILNVGSEIRRDLPWTSIAADGWAVQVCSTAGPMELNFRRFNPAATLAAAALGASEVFKRLLGVVPPLGELFGNEVFSLLTYNADADQGPNLRAPLKLDCMLVGHGAIGNGIRHALLELPLEGWLAIIDHQKAGEENWGTYVDLTPLGFGHSKAKLAAEGWSSAVRPYPFEIDIRAAPALIGKNLPNPDLVLAGLDNIEARHQLQLLWPDLIIDGAIGDVSCQVSRHPWGPDTACLQCLFREAGGENSTLAAARVSGLSPEAAANQEEVVTLADVEGAEGEKKAWLAQRLGQKRCSVIREAFTTQMTGGAALFSPSAPFVACFSGAMVVAEFIKARMGLATPLDPRFQFNVLVGPARGTLLEQGRRARCFCVSRQRVVSAYRKNANTFTLREPVALPEHRTT